MTALLDDFLIEVDCSTFLWLPMNEICIMEIDTRRAKGPCFELVF